MKHEIREDVRLDVADYLRQNGYKQSVIQEARRYIQGFRLGRQACTAAERDMAEVVYSADKVLRQELSATLRTNRRKPEEYFNEIQPTFY